MSRLITLALCLLAAPAALAADGISPTCVRDGDRTTCAWSATRTLDLRKLFDPAESPVPICIDCTPDTLTTVEMTCELDVEPDGAVSARCDAKGWLTP